MAALCVERVVHYACTRTYTDLLGFSLCRYFVFQKSFWTGRVADPAAVGGSEGRGNDGTSTLISPSPVNSVRKNNIEKGPVGEKVARHTLSLSCVFSYLS